MKLQIILLKPPAGVDYGIQKGRGPGYETVLKQRSNGADVSFEFAVDVKKGGVAGPFVQGPPGGRFVYVDIGTAAGQADSCWSRRLKIPLPEVGSLGPDAVLRTRVAGTGRDGGPSCGTAKPFEGWATLQA